MSSLPTSTSVALEKPGATWLTLISDFVELTKPRISIMVLVAVAVAAYVASSGQLGGWQLANVLVGTGLVAASASAANQWLERRRDAMMRRTADRPIPAGRVRGLTVIAFSASTLTVGLLYLLQMTTGLAAAFGFATWLLYVAIYTPLKTYSPWNTGVGAVAGALPVFIGWTAVGAPVGWRAAVLFSILLLWQFPHFMAIAWIYREDYRRAGMRMLTVVDPTGRLAGFHAVLAALALLPVSIAPALIHRDWGGVLYALTAFAMGFGLLLCSLLFLFTRSDNAARILLRATLVYLPGIFALLVLTPLL